MFWLENKKIKEVDESLKNIVKDKRVKMMKKFIQHGKTNTFVHSISVARLSYLINKKFNLKCNLKELLTGAMLHDFYLYDWHKKDKKRDEKIGLHGFNHPKESLKNAKKYFQLSDKEEGIIKNHMWPLTIRNVPNSKEAWVVCIADKIVSLVEVFVK